VFKSKWLEQNAPGIFMSIVIIFLAGLLLVDSRLRDHDMEEELLRMDRLDAEAHEAWERNRESNKVQSQEYPL
jgi:hypothetical protein